MAAPRWFGLAVSLGVVGLAASAIFGQARTPTEAQLVVALGQHGLPPETAWTCPLTHPIKGNFTTYSGEPCIYHVPGGTFYGKTKPERCYATESEARQDGCRRSRR